MTAIAPPPVRASGHCRHYSYDVEALRQRHGGPQCARGVDLSGSGMSQRCMPRVSPDDFSPCKMREEYSAEDRRAWLEWRNESMRRMVVVLAAIPDRDHANWGKSGELVCPACGSGTVRWTRASVNGHLWASCSTPHCFGMIQ